MKTYRRFWIVLVIVVLVAAGWSNVSPTPARAAGPWYVVPTGNDSNSCLSAGSPCATINGAIGKASSGDTINVAIGTYTAVTGNEVVSITQTINLLGGWDNTFITQNGMSKIDGGGVHRGIAVSSGMVVIIDRFVVQNGSSGTSPNYSYGGGISNGGILTLNNSIVSGNAASNSNPAGGGIYNWGALTLNNSTISDNTSPFTGGGGGILNDVGSTLVLNNSTVSHNTGGSGGGIWGGLTLTLNNSTVSDNVAATGEGGGISGGLTLTLNNSTVSGNTSGSNGGGIYANSVSSVALNNSTVSHNTSQSGDGGGLFNSGGTLTLKNSLLAANTSSGTGQDCTGVIGSSGYNLIGDTTGCAFTPGTGDLTNLNINLGQLIGSPGYRPLLSGSPAINAGNPAGCTDNLGNPLNTDQRGAARVGRCDIGAYEYTSPGPATNLFDMGGTPQHASPVSAFAIPLRAAVVDSLGSPVSDTVVTFFAPVSGASGTFADTETYTTTAVTNVSGVVTATTFTANDVRGAYLVTATVSGVITPASFLLGNTSWYVIFNGNDSNDCQMPATACATVNGALAKDGFLSGDIVFVASGTYTSNTGSEVVLLNKNVTLSGGWDADFAVPSGMSTIDGGGVRRGTVNIGVTATIERFVIQNGTVGTEYDGGGIYNNGILTLTNSIVSGNTSWFQGGGISNVGVLTLSNSAVNGNTAGYYGGGIYSSGILTLYNGTVSNNTTSIYNGGGIYNSGSGLVTLIASTISNNSSHDYGGGIYISASSIMILDNSTVSDNTAYSGGGLYNAGTLTLTNSAVNSNTTSDRGGGISNSGFLTINNSTLSSNSGGSYGSGGINNFGTLMLNNTTVSNNSAGLYGGGISNYGTAILRNSILAANTTSQFGPDCDGTLNSAGYNLIGNTTGCTFTSATGDLLNVNPKLWPTLIGSPGIHPLIPGSPAINAGQPAGCTDNLGNPLNTDQRGVARVGRCDIGAYEYDPANDPLTHVFLPVVSRPKPPRGLFGTVRENGAPAAGVSLDLRFYNGSSWSTAAITATAADGSYSFTNIPSLSPGQYYYVRYQNTSGGNPNRLWTWHTQSVSTYVPASEFNIGNFDLANIVLVSPADGATVSVPRTFQWTPRSASPTDSYEFNLYDPFNFDPYFFTDPPLGYVGSYTINSLPSGFGAGPLYVWELWVYSPDGGYGISYEARVVFFSNTGIAYPESLDLSEQIKRPGDIQRHPMPAQPDVWRQSRD